MKKIIAFILTVALLVCMAACSKPKDPIHTTGGNQGNSPSATQTVYEKLDGFAALNYQKIKLDIKTVTGDIELSASYTLTKNEVTYSVEQLNLLPTDGNLTGISPDYKTVLTGTAKIVNGKVTEFGGQSVTLPSYKELKGGFSFAESNLKHTVVKNNSLTADIISPSVFYGAEVSAENMKIEVEYTEAALSRVTVTYNTEYSTVTAVYVFES